MSAERFFAYLFDLKRQIAASHQVAKPSAAPPRFGIQLRGKLSLLPRTPFSNPAGGTGVPPKRAKLILFFIVRRTSNHTAVEVADRLLNAAVELLGADGCRAPSVIGHVVTGGIAYADPAAHSEGVHDPLPEQLNWQKPRDNRSESGQGGVEFERRERGQRKQRCEASQLFDHIAEVRALFAP